LIQKEDVMPKITGSCLCRSVRYRSDAQPMMTAVCHCENCQRQSGTALAIVVGVPAGSIEFEGEENLATFVDRGESGNPVNRRFCKKCGSPIVSLVEMMPNLTFIKAGTLDDKSWLRPTMHVWCDSAQPWVQIPAGMTRFPKNPG
jgi:hypothetical protein